MVATSLAAPPTDRTIEDLEEQRTTAQDLKEEARRHCREALASGKSLNGTAVGDHFGMSDRWGRDRLREVRDELATGDGRALGVSGAAVGGTSAEAAVPPGGVSAAGTGRKRGSAGKVAGPLVGKRNGNPERRVARTGSPATAEVVVPPWQLIAVAVLAVCLVTIVCAVVSYVHVRDLARTAGMGGLAIWLPLGVDGLVVASSVSLIVDNLQGRRGHPLAWFGVTLGLAGSLAANVMAVDPTLVDLRAVRWVLAGYAPAALAVSGHLLFRMLVDVLAPKPATTTQ